MSSEQAPDYGLVITLPTKLDERELDRLLELVNAKSDLISKSLGTNHLSIKTSEEGVSFPWWDKLPEFEKITAYTEFLTKLIAYAKRIHRTVTRSTRQLSNEKYELRSLLYRIGLSGKEHKEVRKILLAPLSGDSAWKTPPLINTNQEM
ncbi:virulence protein [Actinotignum sanguinis]|uniref:virulence protein n=1 Tax=Actinotignum sanguinis TaxID=1445614 RepID=UPI00254CE443|nr:virulence protein [Actinotignum sanguinis]MDK8352358.1 virulence protein [Actinotignum sanguinis]